MSGDADGARRAHVAGLVEAARGGQPSAFRELFRLHVERVHRIVYRLAGPTPDLDDLVQTTFVEGFRSLPGFRGEALFSTWLGRIAARVVMRARIRRAPPALPMDALATVAGDARPDRDADEREGLRRLDALLDGLSMKKRSAFVLHVLEGHSVAETAAMLDASEAAVKLRIHEARRDLERRARKDPWFAELLAERGGGR